MADYMDKTTAADLLDNLIGMVEDTQENDYDTALRMGIEALKADVQPVVRCKDCKWFNKIGCAIEIMDESDKPHEDDFCSFAERKDGEQNDDVGHIEYSLIRRRL